MTNKTLNPIIGHRSYCLQVPDSDVLRRYQKPHDVYWARLWPASLALAQHIACQSHLVNKQCVVEIGAGLGLPGMVAAQWAANTKLTDANPEAVARLQCNLVKNNLTRSTAAIFNWCNWEHAPEASLVLMSDVNFDPADNAALWKLIEHYLNQKSTILLSTPQRLWAKPFVAKLLPWAVDHQCVVENGVEISLLQLAKP
ncbi:MAG: hypothetical protein EAY75_13940 [Bacteroidetes bacterium]|nr:MAG: hypothetical protein EAY75_13940 [Bacteroidota bacterium]